MSRVKLVAAALGSGGVILLLGNVAQSHNPVTTTVRFNREIAPILISKCAPCHDGGAAMPLLTYEQVRPWSEAIKEEVLTRRMPPWPGERGYGAFANDGGLTPREREFLLSWVDGGAPAGEGTAPEYFDHSGHWMLGQPDAQLTAVDPVARANGTRRYIIETGFTTDVSVRALDLRIDKRAARAAFVSLDTGQYLGGWTPWRSSIDLPGGVAFRVPAGARLLLDVLVGVSPPPMEAPLVAVYLDKQPSHSIARPFTLTGEASVGERRVNVRNPIRTTHTLVGFRVETTPGAQSVELTVRRPDGSFEPLLWISNVRDEWQSPFVLREPEVLPPGSVMTATALFDTGASAPRRMPRSEPASGAKLSTGFEGASVRARPRLGDDRSAGSFVIRPGAGSRSQI